MGRPAGSVVITFISGAAIIPIAVVAFSGAGAGATSIWAAVGVVIGRAAPAIVLGTIRVCGASVAASRCATTAPSTRAVGAAVVNVEPWFYTWLASRVQPGLRMSDSIAKELKVAVRPLEHGRCESLRMNEGFDEDGSVVEEPMGDATTSSLRTLNSPSSSRITTRTSRSDPTGV
ncbi:MAG TPA: hypothetical protein VGO22_07255 [Pseudorhizobium sp.]|jgi:hypothetical protein|nr:hypothetical protein [Pseudorhizobium sp.]